MAVFSPGSIRLMVTHFKKLPPRASYAIPNHYFPMALDLLARRVVDPDLLVPGQGQALPLPDGGTRKRGRGNPRGCPC
ncbi:MAG: hypothetical protein ACE5MB_03715 [Anaerolineae bacterium]